MDVSIEGISSVINSKASRPDDFQRPAGVTSKAHYTRPDRELCSVRSDGNPALRPYLEKVSMRVQGTAGVGSVPLIAVAFVPDSFNEATMQAPLQILTTVGNNVEPIDFAVGALIYTLSPEGDRGEPFPVDDSGPYKLAILSSAPAIGTALWTVRIAYFPFEREGSGR